VFCALYQGKRAAAGSLSNRGKTVDAASRVEATVHQMCSPYLQHKPGTVDCGEVARLIHPSQLTGPSVLLMGGSDNQIRERKPGGPDGGHLNHGETGGDESGACWSTGSIPSPGPHRRRIGLFRAQ
jgi:hypothetical protein